MTYNFWPRYSKTKTHNEITAFQSQGWIYHGCCIYNQNVDPIEKLWHHRWKNKLSITIIEGI